MPDIIVWIVVSWFAGTCNGCFQPKVALESCIKIYKFQNIDLSPKGYDFGFGSIAEMDYMCKTRWHILILQCLQKISQTNCSDSYNRKFQKAVWEFTLNSERYEKAADYICNEYNLKMFNNHKNTCFLKNEKEAEKCSLKRKESTDEGIKFLNSNDSINKQQPYHIIVQKILNKYECLGLKNKLECLRNLLSASCSQNAVDLLINYFRETLPSDCEYQISIQEKNQNDEVSESKVLNSLKQISEEKSPGFGVMVKKTISLLIVATMICLLVNNI